jgi:hypothetical protein
LLSASSVRVVVLTKKKEEAQGAVTGHPINILWVITPYCFED